MDALHASLKIRERPFLLDMNRAREKDVGDVVQRMVRIPRMTTRNFALRRLATTAGSWRAR